MIELANRLRGGVVRLPRNLLTGLAIVALLVVAGATTPGFATLANASVIVRAASITGVVAIGMSYVTISGNLFALSASQLGAFLAVLFALVSESLGVGGGMVVTLIAAVVAGFAQGSTVAAIGNPIITTLAFGTVFRGLAALFSGNSIVRIDSVFATWIGTGRPLGIPTQSWAFVAIAALSWFVIRRARIGRLMVLCGANREAAVASGLSIGVALMAIFTVAQFSQAKADLFSGYDFDYIAAVLVGGISLRGGQGSPLQAAFGALLISLLQNLMLLNGFSAGLRMSIVGGLVVVTTSAFHVLQGRSR